MVTRVIPPTKARLNGLWQIVTSDNLINAWEIINQIAPDYRYRHALTAEVKRELLRYAATKLRPVYVGVISGSRTYFLFPRDLADEWLDSGGRAWIIAELEARSSGRVVAFPGNGGGR